MAARKGSRRAPADGRTVVDDYSAAVFDVVVGDYPLFVAAGSVVPA
jgi:hypothetical protein